MEMEEKGGRREASVEGKIISLLSGRPKFLAKFCLLCDFGQVTEPL